jgi:hypothetical protein
LAWLQQAPKRVFSWIVRVKAVNDLLETVEGKLIRANLFTYIYICNHWLTRGLT